MREALRLILKSNKQKSNTSASTKDITEINRGTRSSIGNLPKYINKTDKEETGKKFMLN